MAQSQHSISLLDTSSLAGLTHAKVAIVYTEWNDKIVAEQMAGAARVLQQHNATTVYSASVPGSFELPFACKQVAEHTDAEAIIAFGAVIRGGTPHFEYVCKAVTEGITQLNVTLNVPVIFGVLTLDTEEQAWERLGGAHGHKGEEAALTALKMIQFNRNLNK
ncbi:MAG: 6,7-dimethyl-8-ribityllumazine synthase [Chitinophagaceae bacterium]|nr:6,7-dimethyl-8-ribityllumazine synthase [Chitinophagaceae bacterium]MCB9045964.1 6,7-dimethyl-8-ribityllumazine synthase [Chitinophagales bacterium]